jgi:WS/DGAT/MGAT family acyltransferase
MRRTIETVVTTRRRNRQPDVNPPPGFFSAPRTSINCSITPWRRFAFTEVSLDDIKMVKNALGGTVNDVVLALCSGALRQYFADRGETLESSLQAMVPISVRTEEQKGAMGNQVSSLLVSLATDIADPVERLHAITAGTTGAKEQEKAIGAATLTSEWAEFAAPALAARAARLYSRTKVADRTRPLFNVTISNVPGPNFPLYSAGARMVAMYPMGPIADGAALNITVMSYMGSVYFGLVADRDSVPQVWDLARNVDAALVELKKAADSTSGATTKA